MSPGPEKCNLPLTTCCCPAAVVLPGPTFLACDASGATSASLELPPGPAAQPPAEGVGSSQPGSVQGQLSSAAAAPAPSATAGKLRSYHACLPALQYTACRQAAASSTCSSTSRREAGKVSLAHSLPAHQFGIEMDSACKIAHVSATKPLRHQGRMLPPFFVHFSQHPSAAWLLQK